MKTEKQIIDKLKKGDHHAMKELMEIHQDYVYTLVYQMVKTHTVAEEITQDVFVKVFKKIDTYQERAKFSTWLYTISYRTCLNYLDKKKIIYNMTEMENSNTNDFSTFDQSLYIESNNLSEYPELKNLLWQAIDSIPQMQGVVITLYYLQQFSISEIAEMMTVPQNTIKINLFRGRQSLKSVLLKNYSQEELL